jgi:hypothetical protein
VRTLLYQRFCSIPTLLCSEAHRQSSLVDLIYDNFCEAMGSWALRRTYLPCTERRHLYLSAPPSTDPARGFSTYPRKGAYGVAGMRVVCGGVDAANALGRSSLTTDTSEKFVSDAARPLTTHDTSNRSFARSRRYVVPAVRGWCCTRRHHLC